MDFNKNFKIFTTIIFAFSLFAFSFPASAQKVLQCAPMKVTVNNDLEVKNDLLVDNKAVIANDLTVSKDIFAASGSQKIYLGPDAASPYISNNDLNSGEGILFKSNGGDDFLWRSPSGTAPDAMILRAGGGLPNNNNYNLQVFGQVSPYQLHTQIIHLDSQGIGSGLNSNIIKLTNTAGSGNGAGIFIGDGNDNLLFSALQGDGSPGTAMLALDTSNNHVGVQTVNPQITLAIGDNDTGLKWNSDGNFSLYTDSSERMKIDSAGDVSINNRLCLGGVCRPDWPAAIPETDPTVLASVKDGVAWGELSGIPADISDGDQVGLTAVAWGDVSAKPAICPIGQFVIDISAGTCAVPPAAAAEADTLATVTTRGNSTTNAITVGGLTVDTNTLYVDSVNNRVGIGTLAPSYELDMGAANSRIRLQNPTAVLNSYITAGMENSTIKNSAVAVKDSLWVTKNAFIDGNLTVQGGFTMTGACNGGFIRIGNSCMAGGVNGNDGVRLIKKVTNTGSADYIAADANFTTLDIPDLNVTNAKFAIIRAYCVEARVYARSVGSTATADWMSLDLDYPQQTLLCSAGNNSAAWDQYNIMHYIELDLNKDIQWSLDATDSPSMDGRLYLVGYID